MDALTHIRRVRMEENKEKSTNTIKDKIWTVIMVVLVCLAIFCVTGVMKHNKTGEPYYFFG